MNKQELVGSVAESCGLARNKAQEAVEAVFDCIKECLANGDDVRLVGVGTFTVHQRAASTGRNPRTGESINIAASKMPKFKPGKELKDAVNATKGKKKAA